VPELDLDAVVAKREAVIEAVVAAGYRWAALDLAGLRSGGFNQLLR
jgi:PP-loop superfamily ATP-utilizing enzyme